MSIESIITQISVIQATITGIKQAHDNPPGSINSLPCFVNFPSSGEMNVTPSRRETKHTIKMQLYVTKQVLPEAEKLLRPFIELTLDKFDLNVTIGGACSHSRIASYEYGILTYGGHQYLGISFDIICTELEGKSFS